MIELSPKAYMALCAMVREELELNSDAAPLLQQVARELAGAMAGGVIPAEIANQPERVEALRRAGFIGQA